MASPAHRVQGCEFHKIALGHHRINPPLCPDIIRKLENLIFCVYWVSGHKPHFDPLQPFNKVIYH
jgi:hypothetical protein